MVGASDKVGQMTGYQSEGDALRQAEQWLDVLVEKGRYDWERLSPLAARANPTPELPCRVLAGSKSDSEYGHRPFLMLMAGKKQKNRYWQYVTCDVATGVPHRMDKALADVEALIADSARIARIPPRYGRRLVQAPPR